MRTFILCLALTSIILHGCSSPRIKFAEYEWTLSDDSRNKFLDDFKAKDSIFSIIIFTSVFKKDLIRVETRNKILFNDTIKSDRSLGLAKIVRINNTFDVKVTDLSLNYSFNLKKKHNVNYKYIYIQRKRYDGNKYVVTYSNTLRQFK
ncbi:hypothetical protein [Flavobacterium litorale]|uniref:Uncharacterized protein n=1 Tax=Flavobacterium litorale TaxID=2856519 RepID=A0ABX8V7Z2_9FLAO|nr:hypothetical protein [Flavobacterium litorale]QYJ68974.1 hypothetical protein K1I41_03560 [Flavobacterium litorale]